MQSFREIIDTFGVKQFAAVLGITRSHVHVMRGRNCVPPHYWRKILEGWPPEWPAIDLRMLDDLYVAALKEREKEAIPASSDYAPSSEEAAE